MTLTTTVKGLYDCQEGSQPMFTWPAALLSTAGGRSKQLLTKVPAIS